MNTPWFNYFLSELRAYKALFPWWDDTDAMTDAAMVQQNFLMDSMVAGLSSGYLDSPEVAQQVLHLLLDPQRPSHDSVLETYVSEDRLPMQVISSLAFCYSPLSPSLPFLPNWKPSEVFHTLQAYDIRHTESHRTPLPLGASLFHPNCPSYGWGFHPAELLHPMSTLLYRFRRHLAQDPLFEYDRSAMLLAIHLDPLRYLVKHPDSAIPQKLTDHAVVMGTDRFPRDIFQSPPSLVYLWSCDGSQIKKGPLPPHDAPDHVLIDYIRNTVTP